MNVKNSDFKNIPYEIRAIIEFIIEYKFLGCSSEMRKSIETDFQNNFTNLKREEIINYLEIISNFNLKKKNKVKLFKKKDFNHFKYNLFNVFVSELIYFILEKYEGTDIRKKNELIYKINQPLEAYNLDASLSCKSNSIGRSYGLTFE